MSGVHVEWQLPVGGDGADVRAMVVAVDEPGAILLVLPDAVGLLRAAHLDVEDHLAAFDEAEAGELVDLGAEGPVAIARIDVDGAESALLYPSCASADAEDVRDAAEAMLDEL